MEVLAGLGLGGASLADVDERGALGTPTWSPRELLCDLELRLGLPHPAEVGPRRVQAYAEALATHRGFAARSSRVDPLGTAQALLAWRDALVDAGWSGAPIADGGPRLEALAALAGSAPPGAPDRLRLVEETLAAAPCLLYDAIDLAEPAALWPARWRSVLALLARAGTRIGVRRPAPAGPRDGDLGRLVAGSPGALGDGSLVFLRAETVADAAEATAAWLAAADSRDAVVIRGGERYLLDAALATQGLAPLGTSARSDARPALEVLPLTLELLYAPRDPRRVLELISLPVSPFAARTRRCLALALAEAPGVGGPAWRRAVAIIGSGSDEGVARQLERVAAWFEGPVYDPVAGVPRAEVLTAIVRTRDWLRGRWLRAGDDGTLAAAHAEADAMASAVTVAPSDRLTRTELRQLVAGVRGGCSLRIVDEGAGRLDHVDHPGALFRPRATVVWWHFVAGTERVPPRPPWRAAELAALARAGVTFPDPSALLAAETESWRRAYQLAGQRLLLVVPASAAGEALAPHPLWSEIRARLAPDDAAAARLVVETRDLRAGRGAVPTRELAPLPLPAPRPLWHVPAGALVRDRLSASELETLLGCPLRHTLERAARVRGAAVSLPSGPRLAGQLAHRLIEELARVRSLSPALAGALFDELVPVEAATLLLPGASFERRQLRAQLVSAVGRLAAVVGDLHVAGVEVPGAVDGPGVRLEGRLDLLVAAADGDERILDLKWGAATYRELLRDGEAIQLAVYAAMRHAVTGAWPAAGYFALSNGELLTTQPAAFGRPHGIAGDTPEVTWGRIERSVALLGAELVAGRVAVRGVGPAVPGDERHLGLAADAACRYCELDAVCGRRWQEPG